MEEGLFEKAFRQKNEEFGFTKKQDLKPMIQKPGDKLKSGNVVSQYKTRADIAKAKYQEAYYTKKARDLYAPKKMRSKKRMSKSKSRPLLTKKEKEKIAKDLQRAKEGAGVIARNVKNRVSRSRAKGGGLGTRLRTFVKGSIYK